MKNKFKLFTSLAMASVMTLSMGTGCNFDNSNQTGNNDTGDNNNSVSATAESFVSIDINPEIELTVDKNDVVISAHGANEDGQILLYGETEIVGEDVEEAIDNITDIAVDLGYISEDNKVVQTNVTSKKHGKAEELEGKINAKFEAKGLALGLRIKANTEGAFSLMREYENFLEEHPDLAETLSVKKFKLALAVSQSGEITIESAVEMTEEELIDLIKGAHDELKDCATEGFKEAKKEAKRVRDEAIELAIANVYDDFYTKNLAKHPLTGLYYGKLYKAYKTGEIVLDSINDLVEMAFDAEETALDESVVNAVTAKLGVSADVLKDDEGNITIESIEDYLDIFLKNADENEDLDTLEDELEDILDNAEDEIENNANLDNYVAKIEGLKAQFEGLLNFVPEEIATQIEEVVAGVTAILEDGITLEELEDLEDLFEDAAEDTLELIEADLSEDELSVINDMIKEIKEGADHHHKAFEDAVEDAREDAREHLEERKQHRKEHHGRGDHRGD